MALATYNGFTGEQRMAAHYVQQRAVSEGRLTPPTLCIVCGQTDGAFDMHLEDYGQPFRYFALCLTCHLMLHVRFHRAATFARYRGLVRDGWRAPALERRGGFSLFQVTFGAGQWPDGAWHGHRGPTFLDQLAMTRAVPERFLMPDDDMTLTPAPEAEQLAMPI